MEEVICPWKRVVKLHITIPSKKATQHPAASLCFLQTCRAPPSSIHYSFCLFSTFSFPAFLTSLSSLSLINFPIGDKFGNWSRCLLCKGEAVRLPESMRLVGSGRVLLDLCLWGDIWNCWGNLGRAWEHNEVSHQQSFLAWRVSIAEHTHTCVWKPLTCSFISC